MNRKPYIGITGFMNQNEINLIGEQFNIDSSMRGIQFMIGILMSQKTLHGKPNRYPNRYPDRKDIPALFWGPAGSIRVIHYSTDTPETLAHELMMIVGMYGHIGNINIRRLNGFQLNIAWPPLEQLQEFRAVEMVANQNYQIILQVNRRAIEQVEDSPDKLVEKLKEYEGVVDHILLDQSGGTGKSLDVEYTKRYVERLIGSNQPFGISIAGGLSAESLRGDVLELLKEFPSVSIDAEGRIRDESDKMDLEMAGEYIGAALSIYKENHRIKRK